MRNIAKGTFDERNISRRQGYVELSEYIEDVTYSDQLKWLEDRIAFDQVAAGVASFEELLQEEHREKRRRKIAKIKKVLKIKESKDAYR